MSPSFLHNVAAPAIYASSLNILELWDLKVDLADGRPFSAMEDIFHTTLDAVMAFAFGKGFKENATSSQLELIKTLQRGSLGAGGKDTPVKFPTAKMGPLISSVLTMTAAVERVRGAASMRLKWMLIKMESAYSKADKTKDDTIQEEVQKAVQKRKQHGKGGDDAWVQSAVDHVVDREIRMAEREGRQPDPYSRGT